MKNNIERTIIKCSIRPFDCAHSNPIFTGEYIDYLDQNVLSEHLCDLSETDCEHAYMSIKDERKEKLKKLKLK